MNTLKATFINSLLVTALLLVLASPLLTTQLLGINSTQTSGQVAGTQTQKLISVYPNFSDFDNYASFNLSFSPEEGFQSDLTLSAFAGQIAGYRNLYTIFNNSRKTLILSISTSKTEFSEPFQILTLTLRPPNQSAVATLEKEARAGATWLPLTTTQIFSQHSDYVIVADTPVKRIAQNSEGLVIMPVSTLFAKGSTVLPQSILARNNKLVLPATQEVLLPPQQKVRVDAQIKGVSAPAGKTTRVRLPLQFRVAPAGQN